MILVSMGLMEECWPRYLRRWIIDVSYFFLDEESASNIIEEQLNNEFSIPYKESEEEKIKSLIAKLDLIDDQKTQDALLHLIAMMTSAADK